MIDPGPDDEAHIAAVVEAAGEVGLVLFTHRHFDHTDALSRIVELTGAPTRATDPEFCRNAEPLVDGEVIDIDGLQIEVLATPGHTNDSTCFILGAEASLFSGDTILGRGTTIVAHPDGVLGPYLDSLAHIRELIEEGLVTRILPGSRTGHRRPGRGGRLLSRAPGRTTRPGTRRRRGWCDDTARGRRAGLLRCRPDPVAGR